MWQRAWRDRVWEQLRRPWDIIVVGGGITGAGVLREATRMGLRTLLLEQRDFAWGTSSRSSKLVHGGLRYLMQGNFKLTKASVRERDRLLVEGRGLVDPLAFLLASYKSKLPMRWIYGVGLSIYDLLSFKWDHRFYNARDFALLAPHLSREGLEGGFRYGDAKTDDARLVLRIVRESVADGGTAINYARVEELLRRGKEVVGVGVRDGVRERTAEVFGKVVISATGAWGDRLRGRDEKGVGIRPLRGSHLVFPSTRLPLKEAITFPHPERRRRHIFVFPWEGVTLAGTTDLDHHRDLEEEPSITPEETAYLFSGVKKGFPTLDLSLDDVVATYAGVRPVIGTGRVDPSEESREHLILKENGLITVMGGKLTTFRLVARDALEAARDRLKGSPPPEKRGRILNVVREALGDTAIPAEVDLRRLWGRYGSETLTLAASAKGGDWDSIPGTRCLWAELRWAARAEGVVHLDDLLLRRVRLGLLLKGGGATHLERIRTLCMEELGWDSVRWEAERSAYLSLCRRSYSLPHRS